MEPSDQRDVEAAVGAELGNVGLAGRVVLAGNQLELRGSGAPIAIEPGVVLDQWALLPPEMRKRKAQELARRLAEAHRLAGGIAEPASSIDGVPRHRILLALAALAGVLVVIGVGRMLLRSEAAPEHADARAPSESKELRATRLQQSCVTMRENIHRGAPFGPHRAEGWVVELWLAKRGTAALAEHPAIRGAVAGGKLTVEADAGLAALGDGVAQIEDGLGPEEAKRSPGWRAVTISLREGYGRAFLEEATRGSFNGLADRIFKDAGADLGALYARCAGIKERDVGAWFRGSDAAAAATAMIYAMGLDAPRPIVDRGALLRAGGDELDALQKRASAVDPSTFGGIVGGTIVSTGGVTVTFPILAPRKATSASRLLARRMGLAVGGDGDD